MAETQLPNFSPEPNLEQLLLKTYPLVRGTDNALANQIGKALNLEKGVKGLELKITLNDFKIPFNSSLDDPSIYDMSLSVNGKRMHAEVEVVKYEIEEQYLD